MAYTGQKEGRGWLGYGIYWSEGRKVLIKRHMADAGQREWRC